MREFSNETWKKNDGKFLDCKFRCIEQQNQYILDVKDFVKKLNVLPEITVSTA